MLETWIDNSYVQYRALHRSVKFGLHCEVSSNRKLLRCSSTPLEQYYREAADNANTRNIPLYEGPYEVDDDEYDVDDSHAFGELV